MTILQLYLLTRSEHLLNVLSFVFFLIFIIYVVSFFLIIEADDENNIIGQADDKNNTIGIVLGKRIIKYNSIALLIAGLLFVALPTKEDLYLILGGSYVTNSKEISKLPENVAKAANSFLEHYSKEPVKKDK